MLLPGGISYAFYKDYILTQLIVQVSLKLVGGQQVTTWIPPSPSHINTPLAGHFSKVLRPKRENLVAFCY